MLEFKYVLLIFVFVLSFALPCGKLFCWEPLHALIYAKQILADAKANAAAREKAEAAKREAKRARDEELAESHRVKRLLREQARAKKAALEAAAAAGAKARQHRTPGGMLKTEWDPHGFKHKRAAEEGRAYASGKLKPRKPDKRKRWEHDITGGGRRVGTGDGVADLVGAALGPAPPAVRSDERHAELRPGKGTGAHHHRGEGSSALIARDCRGEFLAQSGTRPGGGGGGGGARGLRGKQQLLPPLQLRGGRGSKVSPAAPEDGGEDKPRGHQWISRKKRKVEPEPPRGGSKKEKAMARHVARAF
jgi:hypothetical protein